MLENNHAWFRCPYCYGPLLFLFLVAVVGFVVMTRERAKHKARIAQRELPPLLSAELSTWEEPEIGELTITGEDFQPTSFVFVGDDVDDCELFRVSAEGFWIKGVKVDDTPEGYQKFYEAFKAFLEGRWVKPCQAHH